MKNLLILLILVMSTSMLTSCGAGTLACKIYHLCKDEGTEDSNTSGITGDASTSSMAFEESQSNGKDLEHMGAQIEAMEVAEMEDMLLNYGLSAERSAKLGKLMNSYSKIKTKRALTSREKDVFTKELTGLSFDKATSVLVDEGYDALVEKASEVNGADPEAIKELLNEVM